MVVGAVATAAVVTTGCGDEEPPTPDGRTADATPADAVMCVAYCFPDGTGTGDECPFPTCATGPNFDQCPEHCDVGI